MIYVNNSATTWPKPENVYQQVNEFFRNSALNPGRSGTGSLGLSQVERKIFKVRKQLAELIGTTDYAQIIFTAGATHSLNIALKGILKPGDHVITTCLEHNSVLRPLKKLEKDIDIKITVVGFDQKGQISPRAIEAAITKQTKLIVTTHASNVIGTVVDLAAIGKIADQYDLIYLVDAAQSAGVFELDVNKMGIDLLALAGHKSLYGPAGIGALYINPELELDTLV
jgi:selenocysteine lyase/cysteine desulfurase